MFNKISYPCRDEPFLDVWHGRPRLNRLDEAESKLVVEEENNRPGFLKGNAVK